MRNGKMMVSDGTCHDGGSVILRYTACDPMVTERIRLLCTDNYCQSVIESNLLYGYEFGIADNLTVTQCMKQDKPGNLK